ncbi:MAG: toll/interleukin-1 receptor domain-containing protein, partial [Clostridia bacterium]|nr:toll/interleukin-1 receptor domain-containing protein [Clostridia bacterium]
MEHDVFISYSFKDQAIAEKIVNTLTSIYGLTCWICTREIRGGEKYKERIVEAIDEAEVVVLIVSENSVVSKEIPKEVGLALEDGKTVVPFKIDQSRIKGEMRYDLMGTNWIDGSEPPVDDRIDELAEHICMILGKSFSKNEGGDSAANNAEKLVSTPSVIPKNIFCGRDGVLAEIDEKFEQGERALFLCGIGGIGKTQIAKQYAKQHRADYDTIIYATYNGSLKSMIIAEEPFKIEPAMIRYTLSDGSKESDDDFYARKFRKIKELATERTLVILDNFDVMDDGALAELLEGRYRLLITTRCDYSRMYATVKIEEISSMAELKKVFFANYKGDEVEEDDEHLGALIEAVNRHTYTVELLAQHMENSGQTTEEMLEALRREGIMSLSEAVRGAGMQTQIAYENLLKMFKIFSLTEEEKTILSYLSLMPIDGVKKSDFKKWAALPSLAKLNALEERGWIVKNTGGIALHPIVRDVVRHECKPTEEGCKEFLDNLLELNSGKYWNLKKTEKDRMGIVFKSILSVFNTINENTEDLYYDAEELLSFAVDPEYASELALKLYEYHSKVNGENSYKTARAAYKCGWLYAYNLHLPNAVEKALTWLGKASEIFETLT